MAAPENEIFLIDWKGNRVPRSAKLDNKTISWAQGGIISLKNVHHAGNYIRLIDPGQHTKSRHVMLAFVNKQHLAK